MPDVASYVTETKEDLADYLRIVKRYLDEIESLLPNAYPDVDVARTEYLEHCCHMAALRINEMKVQIHARC